MHELDGALPDPIVLQVWDKDTLTADDFMGEVRLGSAQQLLSTYGSAIDDGMRVSLKERLVSRASKADEDVRGELHVDLQRVEAVVAQPDTAEPSMAVCHTETVAPTTNAVPLRLPDVPDEAVPLPPAVAMHVRIAWCRTAWRLHCMVTGLDGAHRLCRRR